MNRIDRVSAILIQLQSRRLVRAQEIADRFNVSLRTIYRDIKTLEEAGVPVIGEAGAGYSLMEGYRLPPVMFTREEATAFITAGKLVNKLTDKATKEHFETALFKVKAVLRGAEKDHVEHIEDGIEVIDNPYLPGGTKTSANIPLILECIADKAVMHLVYFANHTQQQSDRDVEPVGVFYNGSNWYLIAFCRLRFDYRHFRLDRVVSLKKTDLRFRQQHPSLKEFIEQLGRQEPVHKVVIRIDRERVRYFGDQKYYNGYVSEKKLGNKVEMTFLTCSLRGFAHWYMMFGDCAEIVSPESLREEVISMAQRMLQRLGAGVDPVAEFG